MPKNIYYAIIYSSQVKMNLVELLHSLQVEMNFVELLPAVITIQTSIIWAAEWESGK